MKSAILLVLWTAMLVGALLVIHGPAHADELATSDQVLAWIDAYAWRDATPAYPHDALYRDAIRVARCESDQFDIAVLNDARLGARGEVGTFQFMTGQHSVFWATPSAAAGWDMWDPEANVAGAIWLISRGFGPRYWSCW